MLNQGVLPPADAVRIEEFINYFDYHYDSPEVNSVPFSVQTDIAVSPWDSQKHLIRIALQGYVPEIDPELGRNLVFLLDVSGSMDQPDKLPLLSRSLNLLSRQLSAKDSVAIVVYAGASGVVLEPTPGDQYRKIQTALNQLKAGGATNGHAGIELAYDLAEQALIKNGINRVILATDGDFNVGIDDHKQLVDLIKTKKKAGIALTTLGFGQGNYNDYLMEQLADAGNGNYYYIDTINEARKVLVDELNSTLMIIAKDVKVQVEFNPANVAEYRLMGYENRVLKQEDFNNDVVDASEIGAGHKVTAFYEVSLVDSDNKYLDPLRYQTQDENSASSSRSQHHLVSEIALVKLRYKPLDSEQSILLSHILKKEQITDFNQQSDDFRFASAVVGFAHKLKNSVYLQNLDYIQLVSMAQEAKGQDEFGYRAEFIQLLRSAQNVQVIQATSNTLKTLATGRLALLNENNAHQ
jgi:Ca-activated chloride channel family protein